MPMIGMTKTLNVVKPSATAAESQMTFKFCLEELNNDSIGIDINGRRLVYSKKISCVDHNKIVLIIGCTLNRYNGIGTMEYRLDASFNFTKTVSSDFKSLSLDRQVEILREAIEFLKQDLREFLLYKGSKYRTVNTESIIGFISKSDEDHQEMVKLFRAAGASVIDIWNSEFLVRIDIDDIEKGRVISIRLPHRDDKKKLE